MAYGIVLSLLGGLVLFLFSLNYLSDNLQKISGSRLQHYIDKYTSNIWWGLLAGTLLTILLDSSSAVIIVVIALIKAGKLPFRQAMGLVLGANIGTTVSSQIIAMDIGKYSAVLMLVGFVLSLLQQNKVIREVGTVLLGFGLIFFSLLLMENAVEPLKDSASFEQWLTSLENPWKGAGVGGLVTLVVQSSSAMVGMVIVLGNQNLISLAGAISVMLGAELGTCSDTLLASLGKNKDALKTGLFHLLFNLASICLGLIFFTPFVSLVQAISGGAPLSRQIANAHVLFNCLGVLLVLPLIPAFEKGINRLVGSKAGQQKELEQELAQAKS